MSNLGLMPPELLHNIFSHISIPTWGSTSDYHRAFAGLARSCRALHDISIRYLYARYEAPLEQPITGFLRRLAQHDDLSHMLKQISILGSRGPVHRRLRREIRTQISHLSAPYCSVWSIEARDNLASRNELELAILVLEATSLESLTMEKDTERRDRRFDNLTAPPPWLLPLLNAGRDYALADGGLTAHLPYQTLHSLKIDLQDSNSHCLTHLFPISPSPSTTTSLTHLFNLPALQNLHIRNLLDHAFLRWLRHGGGWEDMKTYPSPTPPPLSTVHSPITSLVLENIQIPTSHILWMIHACESLHTFSITGVDTPQCVAWESRRWCADILAALSAHSNTLEHLRLDPDLAFPLLADRDESWPSLSGIEAFHMLKSLDTTFSNLVGHPQGRVHADGVFRFESVSVGRTWWRGVREVLPERCKELRVRFDGILEVNSDEVFLVLLAGDTGFLRSVEVYYHYGNMFLDSVMMLPVNFWDVQEAFRQDGRVEFGYTIGFDLWGSGLLP